MGGDPTTIKPFFVEKGLKQVIDVLEYARFDLPFFSGDRS